jgi:hypothetical protein
MTERAGALRVWRLRKRNLYVDAELQQVDGTGAFDLLVFYGTTLTWSQRFDSRSDAITEAKRRRADLEREGWTFHW